MRTIPGDACDRDLKARISNQHYAFKCRIEIRVLLYDRFILKT
jgi:hypothetical protein